MAAKIKGVTHHVIPLSCEKWMVGRVPGIWYTDGQKNLLHMQAVTEAEKQREYYRINLNGFLGDAVLGGSYLHDRRWSVAEKINNRGRRFINEGVRLINCFFHNRLPFFDNALMEFTFSIPESLRSHSLIYNRMLLKTFPALYRAVPWQTTGVPISYPPLLALGVRKFRGGVDRLAGLSGRIGVSAKTPHRFADYDIWLRNDPAQSFFNKVLFSPSALYPHYVPHAQITRLWTEHAKGAQRAEKLALILTFELWLQQVYEKKYRDEQFCRAA